MFAGHAAKPCARKQELNVNVQQRTMITLTRYVIAVPDLVASAHYYQTVLDFEIHEIGDPGWRIYINGACSILAGHCPDAMPIAQTGDHSYVAYWIRDDVDAYYQTIRDRGATILKPLQDEPWGMRECCLRTIDGHRIMIAQAIAN
jgi:predicted enzyme related to lactoylglutathione lyase